MPLNELGMTRIGHGLKLLILGGMLAIVLATGDPSCSPGYVTAAPDTTENVVLTAAEADSLIDLIDDQALEIRLLEIDLREARSLAANDSTLAAHQLALQNRYYEQVIAVYKDDRDSWVVKALQHPAIWFMVGAYAGMRVTR